MKVKIVNPEHAAGLIDPHTRRSPFVVVDETTGEDGTVTRTNRVVKTADVPETSHWHRRLLAGEVERVEDTAETASPASAPTDRATPTGTEPIKPRTTR